MKIRNRIILIFIILFVNFLVNLGWEVSYSNQLEKLNKMDADTLGIQKDISLLKAITNDYVVFRESRDKRQWLLKFKEVNEKLKLLEPKHLNGDRILSKLSNDLRSLQNINEYLELNYEKLMSEGMQAKASTKRTEARLKTELSIIQEEITTDLLLLDDLNIKERAKITERSERARMISMLLFGILTVYLVAVLGKRLFKSIRIFIQAIEKVDAGNLDYRISIPGQDEFSRIADKFNGMIQSLRMANDEIKRAKTEAEEANLAKSQFLANMSHEIRTPLNGIMGITQLMQISCPNEKFKNMADAVLVSSVNLLHIVNDILDLSKIECGGFVLVESEFLLTELVGNLKNVFRISAHKKGLELLFRVRPGMPDRFLGDGVKVSQILNNLIGNAIKFTESGHVCFSVQKIAENPTRVTLEFTISDTGIGISEEEKSRIFHPFVQGDISYQKKYQGTGLGLTISKRLAELMGGELSFESMLGEGTTFRFTLNLKRADGENTRVNLPNGTEGTFNEGDFENWRVLLMEHHSLNREILAEIMRDLGMDVTVCGNGRDGVELLIKNKYDLILVDMQMSDMSGLEVADKIVELNGRPTGIFLFLTSEDIVHEWNGPIVGDHRGYLVKPVLKGELLGLLEGWLGKPKSGSLPEMADEKSSRNEVFGNLADGGLLGVEKDILVVEDNIYNQEYLSALLELNGFGFDIARNGEEALKFSRAKRYAIIFMDIQLPVLSGVEALKRIREDEGNPNAESIIIATTAYAISGDREKFLAEGFDNYLAKPFVMQDFLKMIHENLK